MKLPIKKEFFDQIKAGKKDIEYRDAHITFICEETGETLRKNIQQVSLMGKRMVPKEYRGILEDDWTLAIWLEDP